VAEWDRDSAAVRVRDINVAEWDRDSAAVTVRDSNGRGTGIEMVEG